MDRLKSFFQECLTSCAWFCLKFFLFLIVHPLLVIGFFRIFFLEEPFTLLNNVGYLNFIGVTLVHGNLIIYMGELITQKILEVYKNIFQPDGNFLMNDVLIILSSLPIWKLHLPNRGLLIWTIFVGEIMMSLTLCVLVMSSFIVYAVQVMLLSHLELISQLKPMNVLADFIFQSCPWLLSLNNQLAVLYVGRFLLLQHGLISLLFATCCAFSLIENLNLKQWKLFAQTLFFGFITAITGPFIFGVLIVSSASVLFSSPNEELILSGLVQLVSRLGLSYPNQLVNVWTQTAQPLLALLAFYMIGLIYFKYSDYVANVFALKVKFFFFLVNKQVLDNDRLATSSVLYDIFFTFLFRFIFMALTVWWPIIVFSWLIGGPIQLIHLVDVPLLVCFGVYFYRIFAEWLLHYWIKPMIEFLDDFFMRCAGVRHLVSDKQDNIPPLSRLDLIGIVFWIGFFFASILAIFTIITMTVAVVFTILRFFSTNERPIEILVETIMIATAIIAEVSFFARFETSWSLKEKAVRIFWFIGSLWALYMTPLMTSHTLAGLFNYSTGLSLNKFYFEPAAYAFLFAMVSLSYCFNTSAWMQVFHLQGRSIFAYIFLEDSGTNQFHLRKTCQLMAIQFIALLISWRDFSHPHIDSNWVWLSIYYVLLIFFLRYAIRNALDFAKKVLLKKRLNVANYTSIIQ